MKKPRWRDSPKTTHQFVSPTTCCEVRESENAKDSLRSKCCLGVCLVFLHIYLFRWIKIFFLFLFLRTKFHGQLDSISCMQQEKGREWGYARDTVTPWDSSSSGACEWWRQPRGRAGNPHRNQGLRDTGVRPLLQWALLPISVWNLMLSALPT